MPSRTPSRKRPTPSSRHWFALSAGFLVALAVLAYFATTQPVLLPGAAVEAQSSAAPFSPKHIYSEAANPKADIVAGLAQARREHKRVILDFGGDWCGDCQVLDIYFHRPPNAQLLEKNFVLIHVWIGQMDAHLDIAAKYGVPISKGVPALAVLAPDGKVLYAQRTGEFEDMRHMDPNSVTEFLEKWKS